MRKIFKIAALATTLFMFGCGPIGSESIITRISKDSPISLPSTTPFNGKFKAQINSGTSLDAVTAGNYKASVHLGNPTNQNSQITGGGYKVSTTFSALPVR